MLAPCNGPEPHCVTPGNPEEWPLIGGLITDLTDFIGMLYPSETGCQNGYYGLALLVVIVGGGAFLLKTKEGKTIFSKVKGIVK